MPRPQTQARARCPSETPSSHRSLTLTRPLGLGASRTQPPRCGTAPSSQACMHECVVHQALEAQSQHAIQPNKQGHATKMQPAAVCAWRTLLPHACVPVFAHPAPPTRRNPKAPRPLGNCQNAKRGPPMLACSEQYTYIHGAHRAAATPFIHPIATAIAHHRIRHWPSKWIHSVCCQSNELCI